ncbi:MAG: O-antigen ligase family protein [Bacilli bacterium]|nr:O-antigen ligase family protein [Bacilli bacterium]
MEKKNERMQLVLTAYIILNVLYLLIASFLACHGKIPFENYANGFIALFIVNVIIIIGILWKNYKKNKIDILLILCIIFAIISTLFAYRRHEALFGLVFRYEGLFQICYYLTILFISSFIKNQYKKYIISAILLTGLVEVFYGFLQVTNSLDFLPIRGRGNTLANGMLTNSNFYGTYMLICLGYSLALFLEEKKLIRILLYFLLYILFLAGLLISNALSSIVGFICILIYLLIYFIINKKYKKYIVVVLTFIALIAFFTKTNLTFAYSDLKKTKNEIVEIGKGNLGDKFGTNRIYIWKETMKIVPDNLLHGIGIENFVYAFDGRPLFSKTKNVYYDKAHNEYLHILVTQGIFALISYLLLYFIIVKEGIKKSFKKEELYLILPVGGYLVQAFFNISVIEVAPLFYISLGMLVERE